MNSSKTTGVASAACCTSDCTCLHLREPEVAAQRVTQRTIYYTDYTYCIYLCLASPIGPPC